MKRILLNAGILLSLTACSPWFTGSDADINGGNTSSKSAPMQSKSASASSSSFDEEAYFPLSDAEKQQVESHIGSKIGSYVTSPGVLGGKFYVTNIEWYTGNTAIVEYEDGHIKAKARATATIRNGDVVIVQFIEFFSE